MQLSSVTPSAGHGVERASTFMTLRNILILVVIAASLAFFAKGYVLFQATMVLAYAIALVGLNLLTCLLYTSPSPRDGLLSRMPSSA